MLGGHCHHFPTAVHNPFWDGLLILLSLFHMRKANCVGVISFYGSQEFSKYIFHEVFSTVILYYYIIGLPQQPVFMVWFCNIRIFTEGNLKRINNKHSKISDTLVT